jgi:hypothetical protein
MPAWSTSVPTSRGGIAMDAATAQLRLPLQPLSPEAGARSTRLCLVF